MQSTAGTAGCNAARQDLAAGYKPGKMQSTEREGKRNMTKKENAAIIIESIKRFNKNPEALENFESYLIHNFDAFYLRIKQHPENITKELDYFSKIK